MPYKHGVYGQSVPSQYQLPPEDVGTIPVYIGTAPVHQLADYSGVINTPVLVSGYDEAKAAVGYNEDFANFNLCEAISAHFRNDIQSIGPIILINVLDPDTDQTADKTASVTITNGKGTIANNKVILKSVVITGKTLGTDYEAYYNDNGDKVIIKELVAGSLGATATVAFDEVSLTGITSDDIVGAYDSTTDKRTGSYCIELIYQELNLIPSILLAPGWTDDPDVEQALLARCLDINGHWDTTVFVDIDTSTAGTVAAAITWKATNSYNSKYEKVFWPAAKKDGLVYHLSTLAAVTKQYIDYYNDNIPYETPSNKKLDIVGLCLESGTAVKFDEAQANTLNAVGITTGIFSGGKYVLWGPHMGCYEYGVTEAPEEVFDVNIWMDQYLNNDFQNRNMDNVDKPVDRRDIDYILNVEQQRLNSLITDGKLLYGKIEFRATNNPDSDLIQGDFVFDSMVTYTPPGKSLTQRLQYTDKGVASLTGGEA
ncbi:MAG TPA: phage tail sheath protein [Negativicutes bacterium]|nr:phage tail sheath protein [Negativicutes bacterium]